MVEMSEAARRILIAVADLADVMQAAINRGSVGDEPDRVASLHGAAPQRRGADRRVSSINVRAQIRAQLQVDAARRRRADVIAGEPPRYRRTRSLSASCECGRPRRPHLLACNECLFLDFGGGVQSGRASRGGAAHHWTNALVIGALRVLGPLSAPQLAGMLKTDRKNMRRLLVRLVRVGRCERIQITQEFAATMYGFEPTLSAEGFRWRRIAPVFGRFVPADPATARAYTFQKDVYAYKLTDRRRR